MPRQRERIEPLEAQEVLGHYDIGRILETSDFLRGSHQAAKLLVRTDRGQFILKRRPRGDVDPFRVAFAHSLQHHLASKNFPLPHLVGTRDDHNSMCKIGPAIYELYEFIEAEPYNRSPAAAFEAGRTLAIYHSLVANFASKYSPPSGHYHDSKSVYASFRPIGEMLLRRADSDVPAKEVVDMLKRLKRLYTRAAEAVNEIGMMQWRPQIVHSDWHPGNLLFERNHVAAVIDYDSARIRPRVMDIANGCLQFAMVTGGRDLATWEKRTDTARARAFLRGYDEVNVLSKAELETIPYLMQEVLIAQAVQPILRTGTFAGLDGFEFLKVVLAKMQWLSENRSFTNLDGNDE